MKLNFIICSAHAQYLLCGCTSLYSTPKSSLDIYLSKTLDHLGGIMLESITI